jgi:hypothetical protein
MSLSWVTSKIRRFRWRPGWISILLIYYASCFRRIDKDQTSLANQNDDVKDLLPNENELNLNQNQPNELVVFPALPQLKEEHDQIMENLDPVMFLALCL